MNLSPLHTRSEYLKVIRSINELDVVGNFNGQSDFGLFLNKYIHATERFHYGSSYADYYSLNAWPYGSENELINPIKEMMSESEDFKLKYEKVDFSGIVEEYEAIIAFTEKIIQVIQTEKPAVMTRYVEIMTEIEVEGNKKLKELSELYQSDPERGRERLLESYAKEEITLATIDRILR